MLQKRAQKKLIEYFHRIGTKPTSRNFIEPNPALNATVQKTDFLYTQVSLKFGGKHLHFRPGMRGGRRSNHPRIPETQLENSAYRNAR